MKKWTLLLFSMVAALSLAFAQTRPLTNYDVVKMANAQLGEDIILQTIKTNAAAFDTSPEALAQLKASGVSPVVITAMAERAGQPVQVGTPGAREPLPAPAGLGRSETKNRSRGPLIFVEEVSSTGGIMASSDTTIEAMKTLQQRGVRITTVKEKADYILQVTRQLGKKSWRKDTKVALSNKEGEVVLTKSTRSIGGAMGDVSDYIRSHHE